MQPSTLRTLAKHMATRRRRGWDNNGTNSGSAFNTTIKINTPGDERNRSGDGGRDKDTGGQSGH